MTWTTRRLAALAVAVAACAPQAAREPASVSQPETSAAATDTAQPERPALYPDVVAASATRQDAGTWRFDVTLSSPYDSPARYADAWRILAPDGTELGVRVLTHDHASEQPFTRSLAGVAIPDEITTVTVQGRDKVSGWGGGTVEIQLPDG